MKKTKAILLSLFVIVTLVVLVILGQSFGSKYLQASLGGGGINTAVDNPSGNITGSGFSLVVNVEPLDGKVFHTTTDLTFSVLSSGSISLNHGQSETFRDGFLILNIICDTNILGDTCNVGDYLPLDNATSQLYSLFNSQSNNFDDSDPTNLSFVYDLDPDSLSLGTGLYPNVEILNTHYTRLPDPIPENISIKFAVSKFCLSTNLDNVYTNLDLPSGIYSCSNQKDAATLLDSLR